MAIRKARVNDLVRSFTFAVRRKLQTGREWPFPILGKQWENAMRPLQLDCLVPFTAWAYATTGNYIIANRHIVLLAAYMRDLSEDEQEYAASLMYKYYLPGVTS